MAQRGKYCQSVYEEMSELLRSHFAEHSLARCNVPCPAEDGTGDDSRASQRLFSWKDHPFQCVARWKSRTRSECSTKRRVVHFVIKTYPVELDAITARIAFEESLPHSPVAIHACRIIPSLVVTPSQYLVAYSSIRTSLA